MSRPPLMPVETALNKLHAALDGFGPVGCEDVSLLDAAGRVLAVPVVARHTQPPQAVSAMDGWAVRSADFGAEPLSLRIVAEIPAGHPWTGTLAAGEAARIFTGAPLPDGADTVVIQENAQREGDTVHLRTLPIPGKNVRAAGLDFRAGATVAEANSPLTARRIGLIAAAGHPWVTVRRRPRVAILATGDEVRRPGDPLGPGQIVSSNSYALAALIRSFGGDPVLLPVAPDSLEGLAEAAKNAKSCDLLLTTGGASVGDHDLVQQGLGAVGLSVDFWKLALRPGKPLIFGTFGDRPFLGLPGNPVSTIVCALLFLKPSIERLLGLPRRELPTERLPLAVALPANDERQDYMRARLVDGRVTPLPVQDSAMMNVLADADGLLVRPPGDPEKTAGELVSIILFPAGSLPA
ncbi:MAG: gephyrin-like molybdotransferase Glp [Elstera sp.]